MAAVCLQPISQEASLDSKLSLTPIPRILREAIIHDIFSLDPTRQHLADVTDLDAYFSDWFEQQCIAAAGHASITTHRELLNIINQLQSNNTDRSTMLGILGQGSQDAVHDNHLHVSLDLAVRLLLSTSIGSFPQSLTPGIHVAWKKDRVFETLHRSLWPKPQLDEKVKLPRNFIAANLEKIAGLEIVWSSNLADHLSLRNDDSKVALFHQISFLELHKKAPYSILPLDLVEETIDTLRLLIPSVDKRSEVWFRQKQKTLRLDPKAGSYSPLNASARQIEHFMYWRDRLVILKQTFDDAEPHTLTLWWNDDRKKVQWYTFWVAALVLLLTIVFGMVQSVAGVVQAWAAVGSMPEP